MIAAALMVLVLALPAAAADTARCTGLRPLAIRGCEGLPYAHVERELWIDGDRIVDPGARYWVLDRASSYHQHRAHRRYRLGDGVLRVDAELAPDLEQEVIRVAAERPIGRAYLQVYLPDVTLPCRRQVRYSTIPRGQAEGELDALARFDPLLQEAEELLYDGRFEEARGRLNEAAALRPEDPSPYWMLARATYIELETRGSGLPRERRIEAFAEVESFADLAVERAPERAEGHLWRGIARGGLATSLGNLRLAMNGALGGRGPAWIEANLREAVSRQPEYAFFGFSTRGDALHALAQYYRFAPDAWYMQALGTRGDLDRAIELSRQAVALQPGRLEYRKELGVELLCRAGEGDFEEARREFATVLDLPAITPRDRTDQAHARRLVSLPPEAACPYSRDAMERGEL